MDGARFDRLARELATGRSRRSVVKAAGAAALGALGLARAGRGADADAQCKPAAPLPQSKCTKDAQCCAGLVCQGGRCQGGCRIGGTFSASGALRTPNGCQSCQPSVSTTNWTNLPNGTACDDGNACTFGDVCTGGACGGTAYACTPGECQATATCNGDGTCSFTNKPFGTPTASQTPGDCRQQVCDGAGGVTTIVDDTDAPPDDGNPCTDDVCVNGAPAHPAKQDGTACTTGGGQAGTCQGGACACPAPTLDCDGVCRCGCRTFDTCGSCPGRVCPSGSTCEAFGGTSRCFAAQCTADLAGRAVACGAQDCCVCGLTTEGAPACTVVPGTACQPGVPCPGANACTASAQCPAGTVCVVGGTQTCTFNACLTPC